MEEVICMAEIREQVLVLIKEIYRLGWHVNALEKILLPELRERVKSIESMRDELARGGF